jgi:hypothetical protein
VAVISGEGARNARFDAILPHRQELNHPRDRFSHADNVLQSWKDRTPALADPGRSLCESCKNIDIDTLCSAEGYTHSECYWALVASAEVSKCHMCVMMVNALRGSSRNDFDVEMKLINPFRTDFQVSLRAVSRDKRTQKDNLEVFITNPHPPLLPGKLSVFAA